MKKVTIQDQHGRQFSVSEDDLFDQLSNLDIPGSAPAKSMAKNLAEATSKMREAQKRYFQTRDAVDLRIAKDAERKVDSLLIHFNKIIALV